MRSAWLFGSSSVLVLVLSSGAAIAACTVNIPGYHVLALSGDTCDVSGGYSTTTNVIAGQASGANAMLSAPVGGPTVSFSTSFPSTPAVQADTGGAVTLTQGSVTASGAGSEGLFADGAGSTITASNVTVTTNGGFESVTSLGVGVSGL